MSEIEKELSHNLIPPKERTGFDVSITGEQTWPPKMVPKICITQQDLVDVSDMDKPLIKS